ncbi:MAG: serine/threonine protein kinase, partial [Gemmataceae bacterium]|nr:serine/threonine protein kinase [Gemmataceae bacterium]
MLHNIPRKWRRLAAFCVEVALDLLLPSALDRLIRITHRLYRYFLVLELPQRLALLAELDQVTPEEINHLIELLLQKWQEQLPPNCPLPSDARRVAQQIVQGLRAAREAVAHKADPVAALHRSLSAHLPPDRPLPTEHLDAVQKSVGRLLWTSRCQQPAPVGFPVDPSRLPAIPGYEIVQGLARGGFASVYLARHQASGTLRAVKIGRLVDAERFRRELEVACRLEHPHLVRCYEGGIVGEHFWLAMEYVRGATLAELMTVPGFRQQQQMLEGVVEQLLSGVAALHAAGVVHRDIKPANVMVDEQFRLKLIDFGLVKPWGEWRGKSVTQTGAMVGTPAYMSPEQLRGLKGVGPSSDVYSVGVVVYELFVGEPPHRADNMADLIVQVLTRPVDVQRAGLPEELRGFVERCLRREAGERYANGQAALEAFRGVLRRAEERRKARDVLTWLLVIVLLLGGGGFFFVSDLFLGAVIILFAYGP